MALGVEKPDGFDVDPAGVNPPVEPPNEPFDEPPEKPPEEPPKPLFWEPPPKPDCPPENPPEEEPNVPPGGWVNPCDISYSARE
ncbi:hypothetical protein FM102_13170 [Corynebacterium glutamicum]|nr:hypothetical protein C624_13390 [Corynebacterium glutamicum SCgG1]AGN23269.1 hypothetical protein C629_13395 [Corynebacterium glutamicum SCgG2]EGV41876.1 hypothetical protein CgS9114_00625 [Corynebacterium glutamicum S9114]EPP39674.1 hypothetical protein A583_12929 [Corynebacterium glutamicum Z188]SJM69426.1 hypothetical protein FM102_13170 [Corynebacterium glutamicum]